MTVQPDTIKKGEDWAPRFLAALVKSPNVSGACRKVKIGRQTAYDRRRTDPEFAAAWDDAVEQSTDELVGEMYRRAKEGVEKPVFHQGAECGRVREYSDAMAIFLAKCHRREVYGDRTADATLRNLIQKVVEILLPHIPLDKQDAVLKDFDRLVDATDR
jgi:hypothetical protein